MKIDTTLKQLLIPILYSILIALVYFFAKSSLTVMDCVLFIIGTIIAVIILIADVKVLSKYYTAETSEKHLVTRSTIFILMYVPLALFVITSAGSIIGEGLILALGVGILLEMFAYRNNLPEFHNLFLYQIKKSYSQADIQKMIILFGIYIVLMHILTLR